MTQSYIIKAVENLSIQKNHFVLVYMPCISTDERLHFQYRVESFNDIDIELANKQINQINKWNCGLAFIHLQGDNITVIVDLTQNCPAAFEKEITRIDVQIRDLYKQRNILVQKCPNDIIPER